jgi:hypothetical protein
VLHRLLNRKILRSDRHPESASLVPSRIPCGYATGTKSGTNRASIYPYLL